VAHKTGTGAMGATNDIGVMWPPDGAPVVIAVYYAEAARGSAAARDAVLAEAAAIALRALRVL
jgi:beta-lactamase class A